MKIQMNGARVVFFKTFLQDICCWNIMENIITKRKCSVYKENGESLEELWWRLNRQIYTPSEICRRLREGLKFGDKN